MRRARLKAPEDQPVAFYHVISRVVDRVFRFGPREKERFVELMRLYEAFCGVRVVTFCVMDNHFHILLEVPRPGMEPLSDQALLERMRPVYSAPAIRQFGVRLARARKQGNEAAERVREDVCYRMHDVSQFMKSLKQCFTQWYNRREGRKGTLWEDRFKSVLMEGSEHVLQTMAAYIDLNPVRAGIVEDPKDYRWSGYGQAASGVDRAVEGIAMVAAPEKRREIENREALKVYRTKLYWVGERRRVDAQTQTPGFDRAKVMAVVEAKGELSRYELLRCRVRYFSDGMVLGSRGYVDEVFRGKRAWFGPRRKTGARKLRYGGCGGLYAMRDLQVDVVSMAG
jgi:REP element-mobilizing transposase RayT